MPGKTPAERQALEAQGALILGVFEAAGFAHIAPDILQPADVFLDRSGEEIRARTFVFTDPSGAELCLRPDLTVPACRYHLSHAATPETEARYCYRGPAFRFQRSATPAPSEFDQAGIEWFGAPDATAADAEILALTAAAVEAAGLSRYAVRLGDLGLMHALLHATPMPERWRRRLMHQFWRPQAFHALIDRLTGLATTARTSISPLIDAIAGRGVDAAPRLVERELSRRDLQLAGGRSVEEIAGRLAEKAADRSEARLPEDAARRMEAYLALAGPPADVLPSLEALARESGDPMPEAVAAFARRLDLLSRRGAASDRLRFEAVFGRNLEYYTGFVFQIEVPQAEGPAAAIAGGGRYDTMLSDIGSPVPVPAVGAAIYTERLLAAVRGQRA
jgi:ATP phosphoribosyltransferase regulatory subunit